MGVWQVGMGGAEVALLRGEGLGCWRDTQAPDAQGPLATGRPVAGGMVLCVCCAQTQM